MIQATMSILGLFNYDDTILDNLHLPTQINADALKKRLLIETAELEVAYSDPTFFKFAIEQYSLTRLHSWQTMANVLMKEDYDPFVNVNRHEERTELETRNLTAGISGTTENKVSAFNTSGYSNANKSETEGTNTDRGTVKREMTYDLQGDSALSDTQDLIEKETELRQRYDIYTIIISDIKQNFCLLIY